MSQKPELQTFKVSYINYDAKEEVINVLATGPKGPATMKINLRAYDETKKEYFDDKKAKEAGLERLAQIGGLKLEDLSNMAKVLNTEFEAYYNESKFTFTKPTPFIAGNQIFNREATQLDNVVLKTALITEQPSKHSFRVMVVHGIKAKGQEGLVDKGFKISQLIFDDPADEDTAPRNINLSYATKEVREYEAQLQNDLPAEVEAAIKEFIKNALSSGRAAKVKELQELFGFNIDELIETGGNLEVKLHKNQIPNKENFYLSADVLGIVPGSESESEE